MCRSIDMIIATPADLLSEWAFPEDVAGVEDKIISGYPAGEGDIPYQLSLRMVTTTGGVGACGASLVHHLWAITAAHCTLGRRYVIVRLGVVDFTTPELILETTVWYDHPRYNPWWLQNDITLINLGRHVHYTDYIKPIRIQRSHQIGLSYEDEEAMASGFGLTVAEGTVSPILNYVNLTIISNQQCIETYGSNVIISSTICAIGKENPSQSTCNGDSGGPLALTESDGLRTLIGVVSFVSSAGCASGRPSGYVRPGFYHDWFTQVTGIEFDSLNESS